jgi:hypothetical protein
LRWHSVFLRLRSHPVFLRLRWHPVFLRLRRHPVFLRLRRHPVFLRLRRHPVFLRLRRHPRFAFVLHALPLCGAAPTFFAAAKKVGKESGLTPPVPVFSHGPPTSPSFARQRIELMSLANARSECLTCFIRP